MSVITCLLPAIFFEKEEKNYFPDKYKKFESYWTIERTSLRNMIMLSKVSKMGPHWLGTNLITIDGKFEIQ